MRTHAERLAARDGYFSPESVMRRLGNSPVTPFLGGGVAVLLQVGHPLVAAGVVEHSGYERDLWRRLVGTLRALYLIAFGDRGEAERAAAYVRAVHSHVHGSIGERLGRFPAGTTYSASDPELMLWVADTMTTSRNGLTGSVMKAWRMWVVIGSGTPARWQTRVDHPAVALTTVSHARYCRGSSSRP